MKDRGGMNGIQAFLRILPGFFRVAPRFFVCWQSLSLLHGLSYGIIAPVTQRFFDHAAALTARQIGMTAALASLGLLGMAHVVKQILNGTVNFMSNMYLRRAEGAYALQIHSKIGAIAPVCFEDTQMLDTIQKAEQGKDRATWFMGSCLLTFNFYIPYFACMGVYLFSVKPLLLLALPLVFAPTLLTQILRAGLFANMEDRAAPVRRKRDYYERCIAGREYYKETRMLGAFPFFFRQYSDAVSLLNRLVFRAAVKSDLAELGMKLLSLGGYIGILFILFRSLLAGEISAGAFAAVFGTVDRIFSIMEEMIVQNYGESARNFGLIQHYLRFLHMPVREVTACKALDADADISLQNVSFTYPNGERKAVEDVTFTLRRGETVALVGENGSGKSTLVRLLTGLYGPGEGDVRYGDVSTNEMAPAQRYSAFSAVFQRYQRYEMTLRENIGISRVDRRADDDTLKERCAAAGVDPQDACLHDGYDTMLSREFGGIDLSGGQWQRIAIARGLFRPHQLIVLDEPTAAIDPMEETRVYQRFAEISKGKTALIVTHRLGSAKLADRILVMKQGRLVESGTHATLAALNGEYARLYGAQEQWYRE